MLNGLASIMPAPLKVCINMYTQVMKRQMDAVASPLGNTPQRLNVVVIRPNWPNPWLNSAHLAVTDLCRASTLAGFSTLVCHKLVLKIGRPIFISPKQLRYRGIWKPSAGWNSMGRLVVPFLQSPEPVLEKKLYNRHIDSIGLTRGQRFNARPQRCAVCGRVAMNWGPSYQPEIPTQTNPTISPAWPQRLDCHHLKGNCRSSESSIHPIHVYNPTHRHLVLPSPRIA